jgi:hypothetical protein
MKSLAAILVFAALSTGSSAQTDKADIAYSIYKGCAAAVISINEFVPESKEEIIGFLQGLDKTCIQWTNIWFEPLTGTKATFSKAEQKAFGQHRLDLLGDLNYEYVSFITRPGQ